MVLPDAVLMRDRPAFADDRFADGRLQRAPPLEVRLEGGGDAKDEGRIDARPLWVDLREVGLRVTSLAKSRERRAPRRFDGARHGVRACPVDRGLHRVDGVAGRPERVAEVGAREAVGAPFRADERPGGDAAAPAQQGRSLRALSVDLGAAPRVAGQQKDFPFAASAHCEIAFEPSDRSASARKP